MMESIWFLILSLAVFAFGMFSDARVSMKFEKYGTREAVPLWRDKYHMFTPVRYGLIWAAVAVVVSLMNFKYFDGFGSLFLLLIGVGGLLVSLSNSKKLKTSREKQIADLRAIRATGIHDATHESMIALLRNKPEAIRHDRAMMYRFPWLYSAAEIGVRIQNQKPEVFHAFRQRVIDLAYLPESEWFK
jgi:hypothetical protein